MSDLEGLSMMRLAGWIAPPYVHLGHIRNLFAEICQRVSELCISGHGIGRRWGGTKCLGVCKV